MKKTFLIMMLMLVALCFAACNNDDGWNGNDDPDYEQLVKDSTTILALTFDRFLHPSDVVIEDPVDTSVITVSKSFLKAIKQDVRKYNLVTGMITPDDVPFYKRVEKVVEAENNRLRLFLNDSANINYFLPQDKEISLNSDIYTNPNEPARTNDGSINDMHYYNPETNEYHPFAISSPPNPNAVTRAEDLDDESDYTVLMVEDIDNTNKTLFDWKFNFIDISPSVEDFTVHLGVDPNNPKNYYGDFGLSSLKVHLYTGLRLKMNLGVRKKVLFPRPYVSEFLASFYGGASVDATARLAMLKKFEMQKPLERQLASFKGNIFKFLIGFVPVVIKAEPSLVVQFKAKAEGAFEFKLVAHANKDFEIGCHLKEGTWNKITTDPKQKQGGNFTPSVSLHGKAEANFGIYLKGSARIYGFAGPEVQIGPQITANFDGEFIITDPEKSNGKVVLSVNLGGEAGAEIKIKDWQIAKWAFPFTLVEFYHKEWTFPQKKSSTVVPLYKELNEQYLQNNQNVVEYEEAI